MASVEDDVVASERAARGPARLPAGEVIFAGRDFDPALFARVDQVVAEGRCTDGRLVVETETSRLVCVLHRGAPLLAGLMERRDRSRVPLRELPLRAGQLDGATWELVQTDADLARMTAVHFSSRPVLRSSIRLVDPAYVLEVLRRAGRDAMVAFERAGQRSLLFLSKGRPRQVYFADPADDPREGDAANRLLLHAFAPTTPAGRLEVFTRLRIPADPDAGAALTELAASGQPPPPRRVLVRMRDGREVLQRPFTPPAVVIGRDPLCEILLDNLAVSRRHARIAWSRGRFLVEDLGSANGTRLNGKPVESAKLEGDDRIEIGKFVLTLVRHREPAVLSQTLLIPTVREASELVLDGGGQVVSLSHGAVIGRGTGVDAVARGWRVRPVHARIENRGAGGLEVTCFGRARISVNGERVRSSRLAAGDRLRVGRSEFEVRRRSG